MSDSVEGLVELGFSRLEAEVYTALCRQSPMTGYRVAQEVGKPVANTYKAIEALRKKGAVVVEDGASRLCRAVPPAEFLGTLERRFQEQKTTVAKALSEIAQPQNDARVYQLQTADQVVERCRQMLRSCKEVALLDVFPAPLQELRDDIEQAASRGVLVAAQVYAPATLKGVDVIVHPHWKKTQKRWPGQWVNIVTDGSEHLLAFLTAEGNGVHQAVWSGSPYLSWVYHCAVAGELILAALRPLIEAGAPARDVRKAFLKHNRLSALEAPGYKALLQQFQGGFR